MHHYIFGIVLRVLVYWLCVHTKTLSSLIGKFQAVYFGSQYPVRISAIRDDEFKILRLIISTNSRDRLPWAASYNNNRNVSLTLWWMKVFAPTFYADNRYLRVNRLGEALIKAFDQIVPGGF